MYRCHCQGLAIVVADGYTIFRFTSHQYVGMKFILLFVAIGTVFCRAPLQGGSSENHTPLALRKVAIMAHNKKFVSGGKDLQKSAVFSANRLRQSEQEMLELVLLGGQQFCIRAGNGKFLTVRRGFAGTPILNSTKLLQQATVFSWAAVAHNLYTIKTDLWYLSIEESGAYRLYPKETDNPGVWEQFTFYGADRKPLPAAQLTVTEKDSAEQEGLTLSDSENVDGIISPTERAIIEEINVVRTRPLQYSAMLQEYRRYYKGKLFAPPGKIPLKTKEGIRALDDVIRVLRSARSMPLLRLSPGLCKAARAHIDDAGREGLIGHIGTDNSTPAIRASRFGYRSRGLLGENCSYGLDTPRDIVMQLLIDDGMPGREHRKNILNPLFFQIGVAIGAHKTYRTMSVQVLASEFKEKI